MMQNLLQRGLLGTTLAALMLGTGAAPAYAQRVRVPADTLVRAQLNERVSTRTARVGDRVVAVLDEDDRSDFPEGTRFDGRVTEVKQARRGDPATLDMHFDRAILPNGASVAINGDLASLADEDVRTTADGRLMSRRRGSGSSFDWKWVGIGAGGGAVLGQIFGGALLKGALLGGLGGAIYSYLNRDRDRNRDFEDVELSRGTEFGIRMDQAVAFNTRPGWRRNRSAVAGSRAEYFGRDTVVNYEGRPIAFGTDRPLTIDGTQYVPLRPIANAAGWRLRHTAGSDVFTLGTDRGDLRSYLNESYFTRGGQRYELTDRPVLRNGEVYVPLSFLTLAGDVVVNWDRNADRLELTPYDRYNDRYDDRTRRDRFDNDRFDNDRFDNDRR